LLLFRVMWLFLDISLCTMVINVSWFVVHSKTLGIAASVV
jgi:hypothetical protein